MVVTIAIVFPKITQVLSILGGLCSVTMCYFIPTYAYVKLSSNRWYHLDNLLPIIFFGSLIIIGYTSVVITITEMVTGKQVLGNRPDIIAFQ